MVEKNLLALLRGAVTGERCLLPEDPEWEELVRQAQYHGVEALVYYAAKAQPRVPPKVTGRLSVGRARWMFQDIQQERAAGDIRRSFAQAQIPHVLIGGALLKRDYPAPDMRSTPQLTYLVQPEALGPICHVMESLGGRRLRGDSQSGTYLLPPQVTVVFRTQLLEDDSPAAQSLGTGWQYVNKSAVPYEPELSAEGCYLYQMCRLAQRFAQGDVGPQGVLDVYVLRHRRSLPADRAYVAQELKRCGLGGFAQRIEELSEAWFGSGQLTPELGELGDYLFSGGVHAAQTPDSGALTLWQIEERCPWSQGRPWLLPAAAAAGAWRGVASRVTQAIRGCQLYRQERSSRRQQLQRLGLQITEKGAPPKTG
jgi:hypothetical protein